VEEICMMQARREALAHKDEVAVKKGLLANERTQPRCKNPWVGEEHFRSKSESLHLLPLGPVHCKGDAYKPFSIHKERALHHRERGWAVPPFQIQRTWVPLGQAQSASLSSAHCSTVSKQTRLAACC
jgi:hypothetical protein